MATHLSVLAWRVPGTGEPGGLPSLGSHRVGHDWSDLAHMYTYTRIQKRTQHTHTHIYIVFFIFFSIMVYHRMLNIVPCAYTRILFIHSIYTRLHLPIPNSQSHPLPFGKHQSVLYGPDSASQVSSSVSHFRFHI